MEWSGTVCVISSRCHWEMAPSGLGLSWVLIIWKVAETLDGWHRSGPGAVPGTVPLQAWNGDQQCAGHTGSQVLDSSPQQCTVLSLYFWFTF